MDWKRIEKDIETCLNRNRKVTFLVGTGLSADSGIPTFRGKDGFWVSGSKNYRAEEIATKRMFNVAADEVWKWYLYRKSKTIMAKPNDGHLALKRIEDVLLDNFRLISQNVDGLHRKAGSSDERVFSIHGDFDFVRCCEECTKELYPFPENLDLTNREESELTKEDVELLKCPNCGEMLRPHVLWFDEFYDERFYKLNSSLRAAKQTGVLFVIGTSGATNLPGQIVETAFRNNSAVYEVNTDKTEFTDMIEDMKFGSIVNMKSSEFLLGLERVLKNRFH